MTQTTIVSWLLTSLVHSTILLGTAWAVSRLLGERRLSLQETLLRLALVSGLLTSGLQLGLGVQPLAGKLEMNAPVMARIIDSNTKVISIPGADAAAIREVASIPPGRSSSSRCGGPVQRSGCSASADRCSIFGACSEPGDSGRWAGSWNTWPLPWVFAARSG
jgi:hypothetical protein